MERSPFDFVKPTLESREALNGMRKAFSDLHGLITLTIPVSRERALAITKLEESAMWLNKSIVFSQK